MKWGDDLYVEKSRATVAPFREKDVSWPDKRVKYKTGLMRFSFIMLRLQTEPR